MDSARRRRSPAPTLKPQADLFSIFVAPVVVAWGAGVDSTAMIIEMLRRGERIDVVIFADVGNEHPDTYAFIPIFREYLARFGVPLVIVRRAVLRYKNFPAYRTLEEECLMRGTLPAKAFGRGACSDTWKIKPQEKWLKQWQPAIDAWAAGLKVVTCIGFDCSPGDNKRYAKHARKKRKRDEESAREEKPRAELFVHRYPLREWSWSREQCIACIKAAGLLVPPKSACTFCPVMKAHELALLPIRYLRRIVLLEARGKKKALLEGLWRRAVQGKRPGTVPRPGSMTEYIRQKQLLPPEEINRIIALATPSLDFWVEARLEELTAAGAAELERHARPMLRRELREWLERFDLVAAAGMDEPPTPFPN